MPNKEVRPKRTSQTVIVRRMAEQAQALRTELGDDPHADSICQAAVCAGPILARAPNCEEVLQWLRPQLEPWEQTALHQAQVGWAVPTDNAIDAVVGTAHPTAHLYDTFLQHYSRGSRKRGGVFFTPEPIADYIVAQIDRLLREECSFADGLADDRITIIDPACGTGVFLLAVIKLLRDKLNNRQIENLLSRFIGIEIVPPASLLTKLNVALALSRFGYDFRHTDKMQIHTADALSPAINSSFSNHHSAFPVLLGNPPFSSLSTNTNPWISRLVRGDGEVRGYIRANGQHLGERKTWLHDDYVKFIRLAQWHVEQAGRGIVGFVTNHGYLDNATFRLMRHELLRVFPDIEILNLHGNRRARGAAFQPAINDENVFHLDQGIAISLLCRPATLTRRASEGDVCSTTKYAELRGSREEKLNTIIAATSAANQSRQPSLALRASVLIPQSPDWQFVPISSAPKCAEYASAWSLVDAMPVNTTAPVTARDHFVVAFTREELIARIEAFRDLRIPDDEIRERYFHRTRSARYPAGDTRGWKLTAARHIVSADTNWQKQIIRCLYRPFDWRYVFWHPAMIDWPRNEVTQRLIINDPEPITQPIQNPKSKIQNLCLIARRQQLPTQPCTFYWISDCLALDGVIRSDNRGSESLFPLYIDQQANFDSAFIEQLAAVTKLTWQSFGRGDLHGTFGPEDLLAYIYALFHSPTYRHKHADELRRDFPRILLPTTNVQFVGMVLLSHELIDLHLLRVREPAISTKYPVLSTDQQASFRAGGYLALKKWLQPKHRSEKDPDFPRILAAIARTLEIMDQIDALTT